MTKLADKPAPGKASLEAFFTAKDKDVYAILPRWPTGPFTIAEFDSSHLTSVALLGGTAPVRWKARGNSVAIDLPALPADLRQQPLWVVKLSQ